MLRTQVVQYESFGVTKLLEVEVETEPVVKLSADETRALTMLLQKELSVQKQLVSAENKPQPEVIPSTSKTTECECTTHSGKRLDTENIL